MRFRLLTVVWGKEFVDRFLKLTLRSLAAERNLPALVRSHDVAYDIYAPSADIAQLEADPLFVRLAEIVRFRLHPFALSEINAADSMSHWIIWNRAVAAARTEDVYVVTVAADHVFADGALLRWAELFEQGALAIYCPGIQVATETVEDELGQRFPDGKPISLDRRELLDLMFRHLHPVMITMFRGSPRSMRHPEYHLRGICGRGFAQNVMTSHAVAFHPNRIHLADNFDALDQLDRVAFEPSWFLSAEPMFKYVHLYWRSLRMDGAALSHCGGWSNLFMPAANLRESLITHCYTWDHNLPAAERRRHELGARFYVGQMHASRTLYRLWHSLRDAGLFRAAQWLAAGHIFARVRRRLPARRPFTIFVPHDAALVELAPAEAARLLSHGGAGLIAALRAHVAAGHYSPAPGDWLQESDDGLIRMMNGRRYTLGRRGIARIRRGPIRVDGIEIYIIDAPLIVAEMKAKAFGDLACRVAWNMRRSAKIGRAILIKALRRHPRAFACVRGLRERWGDWRYAVAKSNVSQSTIGMASNTESDVAELEANILCRRALAARTIAAVQRLYGFYNGVVLAGSGLSCRPAARLASIPSVDVQTVADWLVRAVEKAPQFAEVWLELGDVRTENGDTEGALAAYDQARTQPSMSVRQLGQSDPRAAAVLAWARLMEIRGRGAQACSGLDAMNLRGPWPWQLHFWRARMLVELGRSEEALDAFERSLEEGAWSGRFDPLLPRNPTDAEKALRVNSAATH